jgi:hypothetical protein
MSYDESQMSNETRMTNKKGRIRHWVFGIRHSFVIWLSTFVIFASVGCSGSRIAPVSGRIALDGKPLAGVHVSFQPIAKAGEMNPGGGSYAITDSGGQFTLLLVEGEQPGAVIGKHRVEITARSEPPPANIDLAKRPPPKVFVPAKYSRNSELTFEVPPGGTAAANFELKSQP